MLEVWREITAEHNGKIIKGSFKFVDGMVTARSSTEPRRPMSPVILPSNWRRICSANWHARDGLKNRTQPKADVLKAKRARAQ
jgi:hypothetical protein